MKIYLAGPISGKSYEEVFWRLEKQKSLLQFMGYEALSPLSGKEHLVTEKELRAVGYADDPVSNAHSIYHRDKWMITQQADVILADLSTAKEVSIGTCFELAWADLLGIHTVVIMMEGDLHDHGFVREAADVIFETVEEAYDYLNKLVRR